MLSHPELLDRVFQPQTGTFTEELAQQLLALHFPPEDHARYEELSMKAQEGNLSPHEQTELDDYLNLNDFLIILKAKARASIKKQNNSAA
jgi:hypothetical protein